LHFRKPFEAGRDSKQKTQSGSKSEDNTLFTGKQKILANLLRQEQRANRKHRVGRKAKTIYYLQGNRKF